MPTTEQGILARPIVTAEGDRCIRMQIAEGLSRQAIEATLSFRKAVEALRLPGVTGSTAAYCVVSIGYDPTVTSFTAIADRIRDLVPDMFAGAREAKTVVVPVCYAPEYAPDLGDVAASAGMPQEGVIALHSEADYSVAAVGFVPGFAYLHGLPDGLRMPRLATSRVRVPRGSVAIGGQQTGVYPFETPGGWRIIGRTPVTMFDPFRSPPSLLEAGDRVRFEPITPERYREIADVSDRDGDVK